MTQQELYLKEINDLHKATEVDNGYVMIMTLFSTMFYIELSLLSIQGEISFLDTEFVLNYESQTLSKVFSTINRYETNPPSNIQNKWIENYDSTGGRSDISKTISTNFDENDAFSSSNKFKTYYTSGFNSQNYSTPVDTDFTEQCKSLNYASKAKSTLLHSDASLENILIAQFTHSNAIFSSYNLASISNIILHIFKVSTAIVVILLLSISFKTLSIAATFEIISKAVTTTIFPNSTLTRVTSTLPIFQIKKSQSTLAFFVGIFIQKNSYKKISVRLNLEV